jgi:hypothetical protein
VAAKSASPTLLLRRSLSAHHLSLSSSDAECCPALWNELSFNHQHIGCFQKFVFS